MSSSRHKLVTDEIKPSINQIIIVNLASDYERTSECKWTKLVVPEAVWQRCSVKKMFGKYIQQIYRRTPMLKCHFNEIQITLLHGCSPVAFLHNFRTPFPKSTWGGLLPQFWFENCGNFLTAFRFRFSSFQVLIGHKNN